MDLSVLNTKWVYVSLSLISLWILYLNLCCHKVIQVGDGDGFKIKLRYFPNIFKTHEQKIRIWGMDAPETKGNQPYGKEAKEALKRFILGKPVRIQHVADSHDRWVCKVWLFGFIDVSAHQVYWGHAHNYVEYGNAYGWHEESAKYWKRGLWKQKKIIMPSEWRDNPQLHNKVVKLSPSKKAKRK